MPDWVELLRWTGTEDRMKLTLGNMPKHAQSNSSGTRDWCKFRLKTQNTGRTDRFYFHQLDGILGVELNKTTDLDCIKSFDMAISHRLEWVRII